MEFRGEQLRSGSLFLGDGAWFGFGFELGSASKVGGLGGPAAKLFISRETCSDSIAKLVRACSYGYRTTIARHIAKGRIAQTCLCETKYQGGGIAPFWGSADLP